MTNQAQLPSFSVMPLRGPLLWGLRVVWLLLVALGVGFALALAPTHIADAPYHWRITQSYALVINILTRSQYATVFLILWYGLALLYLCVGLFIFLRRSSDGLALLVAFGLALLPLANNLVGYADWNDGLPPPWNPSLHLLYRCLRFLALLSYVLVFYLFPRGRLAAWPARWLQVVLLLAFSTLAIVATLQGQANLAWERWLAQLRIDPFAIVLLIFSATLLLGLLAQVASYRHSTETQQRQVKWAMLGLGLSTLLQLLSWLYYLLPEPTPVWLSLIEEATGLFALAVVPICFAIAILRHRLWDIDLVIRHTLVYGILIGIIALIYVGLVGGLGLLVHQVGDPISTALATALIAVIFNPLRTHVQRAINRTFYGYRDEPNHLLAQVGQQLEQVLAPDAALNRIVQSLAAALKLPYVTLTDAADPPQPIASHGQAPNPSRQSNHPDCFIQKFGLIHQGELLGHLWVAPRGQDPALSRNDQQVLQTLAQQLAPAVRAAKLTQALQQSRQRIVTAREEERRRIRRDLHDGLGPTLAAHTLQLDAAIDLVNTQPERTIHLLGHLKTQSQELVADIRHLVYDLRPLALDEVGLVNAIRNTAVTSADCHCTVDAPEPLPPLPAAVEVAAYRIVSEALLNVMKHAHATRCRVFIGLSQAPLQPHLTIQVEDNGVGIPTEPPQGIGLQSMRERAEELGGQFSITSTASSGTLISAQLPL